ncbi:hypothetical protein PLESTM_000862000 [Pleodorina starrii]|nr:hypothetical protein PLESTM_000862000 [Pleodorina starrii]
MSPRKLRTGQRISCHFLEADYGEDVAQEAPDVARRRPASLDGGYRWLPPPLPSSGAAGAAGSLTGGAGGGPNHACGLVYGTAPPDRSAVIPPMKRRLITLSTAGNLKISPLSNQQLYHQRIYPVRRPSDFDGGAGGAAAAAAHDAVGIREGGLLHQFLPPPPPGTPSRHPQPPSSHHFLERRELSPRDDNILLGGGFHSHHSRRSSSPEPPPLPPVTPRGTGSRAAGGGGGNGGGSFATPRLVLRPVRPFHERSVGGCSGPATVVLEAATAAIWRENLTPAATGQQQQQSSQSAMAEIAAAAAPGCVSMGGIGRAAAAADAQAGEAFDAAAAGGFGPRGDTPMQMDSCSGQRRYWSAAHGEAAAAAAAPPDAAVTAADGDGADEEYLATAAAAAAAAAAGGMAWSTIEVTVAVRPKNVAVRRYQHGHIGVDGAEVEAVHNGYVRGPACGVFDLTRYLTGRDCVRHGGRWISRSQFEKLGGSTMAKWYRSIRVLPDLEPLGEWLERHGMPVLRGPARRSRKRSAADSGDELGFGFGGGGGGGWDAADDDLAGASPWASGAATSAAEGGQGAAAAPDTWANRMLLQHRDGGGGDDLLVQRLLSTWPLSQPFLRPQATAATAGGGGSGGELTAATTASRPARCFPDVYGIVRSQQENPQHRSAMSAAGGTTAAVGAAAAPAATAVVDGGGPVSPEDADAAMLARVPPIKCPPPSSGHPAPLPQSLALHTPLGGMGIVSAQLTAAPPAPQLASGEAARKAAAEGPLGSHPWPQEPAGAAAAPAGGSTPPPLKRPRLLLHRTNGSASTDGRGAGQPYLFAVQAPPAMLYREGGAASPSDAMETESGPQAMEE